jgi:hypothetical protein
LGIIHQPLILIAMLPETAKMISQAEAVIEFLRKLQTLAPAEEMINTCLMYAELTQEEKDAAQILKKMGLATVEKETLRHYWVRPTEAGRKFKCFTF